MGQDTEKQWRNKTSGNKPLRQKPLQTQRQASHKAPARRPGAARSPADLSQRTKQKGTER